MKNTLVIRTDSDDDFRAMHKMFSDILRAVSSAGQTDGPITMFGVAGDEPGTDQIRAEIDSIEQRVLIRAVPNGNAKHVHPDTDEDEVLRELPEFVPMMH